ncbi:ferrochelatase [Calidifontibacter sp. DB0510]|uniref:Coproporphyrin III ferrochelatase n=1 Tax=Metallococcus carri TaxID=1656884 RepID=A0A967EB36_9MICO|nr:ferrochelatase [Metallococcus carri]NHN56895.1 ferrochelatase [Metallococcus carri]NOP37640.1 ferrochelatase [Calidifontibacter sp. DB2511S]
MSSPTADSTDPSASAPAAKDPAATTDPLANVDRTEPAYDPAETPEGDDETLPPYDAVLLLSFGGPENREEVMPFLRQVTKGRGIPDDRLEQVAEHYYLFDGKSPINDQNRALVEAMHGELRRRGLSTPVLWGNRNAAPFLTDALRDAHERGMRRILVVTTSAYASYSSCRQYRENIAEALAELQEEGRELRVDKVRQYATHPSFARTNIRLVTEAVRRIDQPDDAKLRLVFVTHSIPTAMDDTSGPGDEEGNLYEHQHDELAHVIADEAGITLDRDLSSALVYCSRSGPPSQPWLEPDINDHLEKLAAQGITDVVVAPIGFVSDHMEVVYDLDTEARATADRLGLRMERVPTVGVDLEFVSGLIDLVEERAAEARGESVTPAAWPGEAMPSICRRGCCPNLREALPAACGED